LKNIYQKKRRAEMTELRSRVTSALELRNYSKKTIKQYLFCINQYALGHSSLSSTKIYTTVSKEKLKTTTSPLDLL